MRAGFDDGGPPAFPNYFPPGVLDTDGRGFHADWYRKHLRSLKEPSLWRNVGLSGGERYRFTWLRTFHHPVAVRLELGPGAATVTARVTDGAGGYDPGRLIHNETAPLSVEKVREVRAHIADAGFWDLSTDEPDDGTGMVWMDGAQWIVEGAWNGSYHVLHRQSPDDGPVRELGLYFLAIGAIRERDIY